MAVNLGLSEDLLQSLENAWLRLGEAPAGTELYDEPAVVALLQHESFERIAQQVLRSDTVYIFEIGWSDRPAATLDGPNLDGGRFDKHGYQTEWAQGMHSDSAMCGRSAPRCVSSRAATANSQITGRACRSWVRRASRCQSLTALGGSLQVSRMLGAGPDASPAP